MSRKIVATRSRPDAREAGGKYELFAASERFALGLIVDLLVAPGRLMVAGSGGAVRLPVCTKTKRTCAKRKLSFGVTVTRSDSVTVNTTYTPAASVVRIR